MLSRNNTARNKKITCFFHIVSYLHNMSSYFSEFSPLFLGLCLHNTRIFLIDRASSRWNAYLPCHSNLTTPVTSHFPALHFDLSTVLSTLPRCVCKTSGAAVIIQAQLSLPAARYIQIDIRLTYNIKHLTVNYDKIFPLQGYRGFF